MPKAPKKTGKTKTRIHRCFVVDCPYRNEKGLSYHQVPKNVTTEVKQNFGFSTTRDIQSLVISNSGHCAQDPMNLVLKVVVSA